ncbi:MAG TPA: RNA 3'-terminal phosphate cyclase [Myxococcales bacterium]|nr:RNA 3'-terminal phosphate cyclase [Myxococcales bacterium]
MARGGAEISLDGSAGEGGGQILRTALSLSLCTGTPFRISRIRANRKPPGIRPQHLACVRGAEAISGGAGEGAEVGASEMRFRPAPVRPGEYLLEVGTAGSVPLLLQCLFYPLALAGGGTLTLRGGTHLPHSPSYHYLAAVWLTAVQAYGLSADLQLVQAGFYPQGGGEICAQVAAPARAPTLVELPARGTLVDVDVTSFVAGLPLGIAERQTATAVAALQRRGIYSHPENRPLKSPLSKGTAVFIRAQFENTLAGFTALGERGRPAEQVGEDAAAQLGKFMEGAGALDVHLADQILVPAGLLAAGLLGESEPGRTRFTTPEVTPHLTTHADVLRQFLPDVRIDVDAEKGEVTVGRK